MKGKSNIIVAAVVVTVCIVCVLVIYNFTIGSKVSLPAPDEPPQNPPGIGEATAAPGTGGPGESHATEIGDQDPETKPAEEKKPLPPGVTEEGGE